MSDPYTPWQRKPSYPSMDDSSMLEEIARQRMGGNIRQRRGGLPSFFEKLMQYVPFLQNQQSPPTQNY
jgi:hypothetical protein